MFVIRRYQLCRAQLKTAAIVPAVVALVMGVGVGMGWIADQ